MCTCFIVVGTRLSKYRQLLMEVCIFVKYSKLGGRGNIQPINFNLDYYCSTRKIYTFATKLLFFILKCLIKIVDCIIFVLKKYIIQIFCCLFLPILGIYSAFLPANFEDL